MEPKPIISYTVTHGRPLPREKRDWTAAELVAWIHCGPPVLLAYIAAPLAEC